MRHVNSTRIIMTHIANAWHNEHVNDTEDGKQKRQRIRTEQYMNLIPCREWLRPTSATHHITNRFHHEERLGGKVQHEIRVGRLVLLLLQPFYLFSSGSLLSCLGNESSKTADCSGRCFCQSALCTDCYCFNLLLFAALALCYHASGTIESLKFADCSGRCFCPSALCTDWTCHCLMLHRMIKSSPDEVPGNGSTIAECLMAGFTSE